MTPSPSDADIISGSPLMRFSWRGTFLVEGEASISIDDCASGNNAAAGYNIVGRQQTDNEQQDVHRHLGEGILESSCLPSDHNNRLFSKTVLFRK